jgi:hypothetical protein
MYGDKDLLIIFIKIVEGSMGSKDFVSIVCLYGIFGWIIFNVKWREYVASVCVGLLCMRVHNNIN